MAAEGIASAWQTVFNLGNVAIGAGVLSFPLAFRLTGLSISGTLVALNDHDVSCLLDDERKPKWYIDEHMRTYPANELETLWLSRICYFVSRDVSVV